MLVVGFAHIEHGIGTAVDIHVNRLPALVIHVHAAGFHDALDGTVLDARACVVAAIANLQGLVFQVGLSFKELVAEEVLQVVLFVGFQLERAWRPCTAPAAAHREVALLADHTFALVCDVFKVDGTVPAHVPVAVAGLSIARTTVGAGGEDTALFGIDVVGVGHDGDDGEGLVAVVSDIGTCDDGAGQLAVLKQAETVTSGCLCG